MVLYDQIGIGYDTTRHADPYLVSRLLYHLVPCAGGRYLDVGCGTGNYTMAMKQAGIAIRGVDLSWTMLAQARKKWPAGMWINGNVLGLPFRDASFAGANMTFVHHHVSDPAAGFREIRRVLAPGGRFVLLNGTLEQFKHNWLFDYFPLAMEQACVPFARLDTADALATAGFSVVAMEPYEIGVDLQDWFLYCGKHKPELYLDPGVRDGISAFRCADDQGEIAHGVERLAQDIRSGRIASVMRKYAWDGGDYMFIVAVR